MLMAVKNNLKLIFDYFKLNIKKEWKYKSSFFMQIIMMILNDLFFIIQWFIIFQLVDNIGGYGFKETMLLWITNLSANPIKAPSPIVVTPLPSTT